MTATEQLCQPDENWVAVPRSPDQVKLTKEQFTDAICLWCKTRNADEVLSREEIGRMQKFDRVDAQRKSLIINLSNFYRDHPRADVAPGVLTLVTFLSDNEKGACQMSQAQMAAVLHRTRTTIAEAVSRLKTSGLMASVNGKAMSFPAIPRAVAASYNHMIWATDALKIAATCPVEPTGSDLSRRADSNKPPVPSKQQVQSDTCRVEAPEPVGSTGHNFTNRTSQEDSLGARPRECGASDIGIGRAAAALAAGMAAAVLPAAAAPSEPPAQVVSVAHECWQTAKAQMDAATNPMERRAQFQVWQTATGQIDVAGEFRQELIREFPQVDLKAGLAACAPNVKTQHGAFTAMQVVLRQFGYMRQDAINRQASAAARAAASANPPPRKTWDDEKRDREDAWFVQNAAERAARKAAARAAREAEERQ